MTSIIQSSPLNSKKPSQDDSINKNNNKMIFQKKTIADNQIQSPLIGHYKLNNNNNNKNNNNNNISSNNNNNNNNLVVDECCEKTEQIETKETTTKVEDNLNLEVDVDKEIENEIAKYQHLLSTSTIFNGISQDYTDESDNSDEENVDGEEGFTEKQLKQQEECEEEEEEECEEEEEEDSDEDSDDDDSDDSEDSDYIEESILNNCLRQQQQTNHNSFMNKKYNYIDTNSYFFSRQQQQQQPQKINHIYADTSLRMELIELLTVMKNNEREKGNMVEDVCVHEIFL
ncbi:hypothetical protein ACTFIY_012405 [Dictyostelium cf. discoideum]